MKILAIDPGTTKSGYVVWDGNTVLEAAEAGNNRLRAIVAAHARAGSIDEIAIEVMTNTHGNEAGKTVTQTIFWSGRLFETYVLCRSNGKHDPYQVDRSDVARYLCGGKVYGDKEISQALDKRFPNLPVHGHCKAALAVAVFIHDKVTGEKSGAPFELTTPPKKKAPSKNKVKAPTKKKK